MFGSQWRAGFLNSGTIHIASEVILRCGVGPVHCRMFSGILGFYLLDDSSTPTPKV